jgi:hypothetical protein
VPGAGRPSGGGLASNLTVIFSPVYYFVSISFDQMRCTFE